MAEDRQATEGPPAGDRLIALGKVVGAHGVRGELKVVAYSGSLEALENKRRVFLRQAGTFGQGVLRQYGLRSVKPHQAAYLVALEGIEDRGAARALAGAELALPEAELPPLAEDEYYWYQLVGLEVVTAGGQRLGRVEEILGAGAADVLVVRRGEGEEGQVSELLLPATPEVVKQINLAEGRMVVEPPEGLVPEGLIEEGPSE